MQRIVEPEWLDDLHPADAAAQRSRADLCRLNWLMGHDRLIARQIRVNPSVKRWCDVGSGDGTLLFRVARRLRWRDVHLTLIDRQPSVHDEILRGFDSLGWRVSVVQADVGAALQDPQRFDTITTNLFLHHFPADPLRELLSLISARCKLFIAVEPRRSALALLAARSVGIIGCGPVTRHDAVASVRAGFGDFDLSTLWPDHAQCVIDERPSGLFSHLFVARRL